MRHKNYSDVLRVIEAGKPEEVVDKFIYDYLLGVFLEPTYAAEEEYAALSAQEDRETTPALLDPDTLEVIIPEINYNQIRDEQIELLELSYPHLVTGDPRPIPEINVDNFKMSALVNELRRASYPSVGDQLDAIWKQLNQDRLGGKGLIQECDDRLGEILAVKARYPKS